MRILVIDPCGAALDWCMRCLDDGHEVRWFMVDNDKTKNIGKGIVEKVKDWRDWARWSDMIFLADNTKYLRELDKWRREGHVVIGPTSELADWELNRETGQNILKKHGIATIPYKEFNDYDKAIAYVIKEDKRFVSKPSGDADKALSYVSKSPADMVYMLQRWKKMQKLKSPFILQEFIGGTEMAVGAWFGPGGFNTGWCENWEFKKLMNDDLGVATGEQGTVVRYVKESKLADMVLAPLEKELLKKGHTGYIDVNCIIDNDGNPWPLEFTMRPGWPTFNIQQALHEGDHAEWLLELAEGIDNNNFNMDSIAVGVVMSIPDYPYSHITRKEVTGVPLYGYNPDIAENIHLCEMMAGIAPQEVDGSIIDLPCFVSAGDYILVSSGVGGTIREGKAEAYKLLKKISMPNSPMWRTDIGNRLKTQLPDIQKHGFASDMEY